MAFDSSYIDPFVCDWLEAAQEVTKEQQNSIRIKDEFYMPFVATPIQIVHVIFKITEHLNFEPGARYIAIHLYDKFMCNYFWKLYKTEVKPNETENKWSKVCKKVADQSKLYLMSCLQLASKIESHSQSLTISDVLNVLEWFDKETQYTADTIFLAECKVFKTVGYRMPLYTPFHCIEILIAAIRVGETAKVDEVSLCLLDTVYLQRDEFYTRFKYMVKGHISKSELEEKKDMALEANVLYLAAAVILSAAFILHLGDELTEQIALKLSKLVNVSRSDIWAVANIIFLMALQE